ACTGPIASGHGRTSSTPPVSSCCARRSSTSALRGARRPALARPGPPARAVLPPRKARSWPGSDILRPMRAIPLARTARRKHRLEPMVGRDGTLDAADAAAARRIAARLTAARDATGQPAVSAGEVAGLAAMDAVLHRLIEHERDAGRADLGAAVTAVGSPRGCGGPADGDLAGRGESRSDGRRAAGTGETDSAAPGPDLLAEVLVLAALNEDPAATEVRELVDDRPLRDRTRYEAVVDATEQQLGGR